jgi:hypothetical protein
MKTDLPAKLAKALETAERELYLETEDRLRASILSEIVDSLKSLLNESLE